MGMDQHENNTPVEKGVFVLGANFFAPSDALEIHNHYKSVGAGIML